MAAVAVIPIIGEVSGHVVNLVKYIFMFIAAIVVIVLIYKMVGSESFNVKKRSGGWFKR